MKYLYHFHLVKYFCHRYLFLLYWHDPCVSSERKIINVDVLMHDHSFLLNEVRFRHQHKTRLLLSVIISRCHTTLILQELDIDMLVLDSTLRTWGKMWTNTENFSSEKMLWPFLVNQFDQVTRVREPLLLDLGWTMADLQGESSQDQTAARGVCLP